MERKSIGSFIAVLRKANGLTQRELAEKLGVSDKAVSRWERDETAPDLYLIPVIAEIFGVTSDELLRGERATDTVTHSSAYSEKSERNVKALLKHVRSNFGVRMLICILISVVGSISAMLCNFAFYRAGLGFYIACIFFSASIIVAIIFAISAFASLDTESFENTDLELTRKYIIKKTFSVICLAIILFASCLPLLIADSQSSYTTVVVDSSEWILYGALFSLIAVLICAIANVTTDMIAKKKGIYSVDEKTETRRVKILYPLGHLLKSFLPIIAITLVLHIICISVFGYTFFLGFMGEKWSEKKAFINYMETPLDYMGNLYDDTGRHFQTTIVKTKAKEELCRFKKKNLFVADFYVEGQDRSANYGESIFGNDTSANDSIDESDNGDFIAYTYTQDEASLARDLAYYVNEVFILAYFTEAVIFLVKYIIRVRKNYIEDSM